MKKTTTSLTEILMETGLESIKDYFDTYEDSLVAEERPFSAYMRAVFRKKHVQQQTVFLAADISEGYGYKLISEEKRTKQRDVILRLCLAGKFDLKETQTALKLYGFAPLYSKVRRDAALIVAINNQMYDITKVDEYLEMHGFEALYSCRPAE